MTRVHLDLVRASLKSEHFTKPTTVRVAMAGNGGYDAKAVQQRRLKPMSHMFRRQLLSSSTVRVHQRTYSMVQREAWLYINSVFPIKIA